MPNIIQRFLTFIKMKKILDFYIRPLSCCHDDFAVIIIIITHNLVSFTWEFKAVGNRQPCTDEVTTPANNLLETFLREIQINQTKRSEVRSGELISA